MAWSDHIARDEVEFTSGQAGETASGSIEKLPNGSFSRAPRYSFTTTYQADDGADIVDTRIPKLYASEDALWIEFIATGAYALGAGADAQPSARSRQKPVTGDGPEADINAEPEISGTANWYMLPALVDQYHAVQLIGRQNIQHLALRFMSTTFTQLADIAEDDACMEKSLTKLFTDTDYQQTFEALVQDSCVVRNRPAMLLKKAPDLFPYRCDKKGAKYAR